MAAAQLPSPWPTAPTVEVVDLVKRYPLFGRRRDRALALFGRTGGLQYKTVLDGIGLVAYPGEAIGIIGENGSGKSTLLRVVAGISEADEGAVRCAAPCAAILELGLGFHPEFSGRENALLYGSLLGVPPEVMRDRLPEALAFAELGDAIDQPLRTYSSGMTARLAFAMATHVDPRVLVVDEALAVGDGAFQKKCVDRMVRFKDEQCTVLFCSHAMFLVAEFCERSLWLHQGKVMAAGPSRDVIHAYEDYLRLRGRRKLEPAQQKAPPVQGSLASLRELRLTPAGRPVTPGEDVAVLVRFDRMVEGLPLHVAVTFEDENGQCLSAFGTHWDGRPPLVAQGEQAVTLHVPACPFARGRLDVTAFVGDSSGLQVMDQLFAPGALTMAPQRWEPGIIRIGHRWEADPWTPAP